MLQKNLNIIYSSWDIEQNIPKLVILGPFMPFYSPKTPKIGILKNEQICKRYHYFTCIGEIMIIWCAVPEIRSETQNFLSFWAIFYSFTTTPAPPAHPLPNNIETQNLEKIWKTFLEILSCYHICVP